MIKSIRIAGNPAEIRTIYLQNTGLEHCYVSFGIYFTVSDSNVKL